TFYYMGKNNFEHCIESVDKVRNIAENIKIQLLNDNKKEDIGIFIIVDDLCKALGHAAHWAEQLKWEIERKNINENISTGN
ncbi:MAG: hypothetical protein J6O41_03390, partial [Clostridia bacterium]|nr:hypothetical protein [Clostridia bacterium]